ncbi:MAG: acyl-CoA dehydrogenase family protein [Deltaproteobacteria bacterium]|nr:acyl-CoA dehydrogenase family protein [Deltaproteobacteria bacterium]
MSFERTEEQTQLLELVHQFGKGHILPVVLSYEARSEFPKEIFDGLAKLELTGMLIPETYGGGGLSFSTYAMVLETIAFYSLSVAVSLSVTGLAQTILLCHGTQIQKKKYLPSLTSGKKLGAFSLTEPNSGSDAAALQCQAKRLSDAYLVNGTKCFVTNGEVADIYLVMMRTGPDKIKGISAFVVEKGMKGFSFGKKEKKMALEASPTRELIFKDCEIPLENRIGEEGEGLKVALEALNGGRITMGACAVGVAERAFEEAKKYAGLRRQFGRSIASFQGIQMILADMACGIESARMLVQKAAYWKDAGKDFKKYASMAKLVASDMAMSVTTQAVQIFGGNGYCEDYPVARLMREAKVLQIVEGTNQIQRTIIAREIL